MIPNNFYPVEFKDFMRIKSVGNYIVMYAILDDRVHFEMAVENAVYVTQKFFTDVEEEINQKASNFNSDKLKIFLKMTLSGTTFYRYYPTEEMKRILKSIKLYTDIIVKETKPGTYEASNLKIIESDSIMKAVDGDDIVILAEKVR